MNGKHIFLQSLGVMRRKREFNYGILVVKVAQLQPFYAVASECYQPVIAGWIVGSNFKPKHVKLQS